MRLHDQSIEQLQQAMQAGELNSVALVNWYLDRIERYDQSGPSLNAIQVINSQALAQAKMLDDERKTAGQRSLLHGIPVIVKDNYETQGMPTTAGSILFAGFAPTRDATLVARLKAAGAIIIAKSTMHEFAYGITTVGSGFGRTLNPYNLERNPGGSSGGSGAAIAANFAVIAMGSDTCGSIRIPASQNNLVGLRGTQGLSSRYGIIPLSSSQDIGGPLARSVGDLSIVLDATVGPDKNDEQTAQSVGHVPSSYLGALRTVREAKIGLLSDWFIQEPNDRIVSDVVQAGLQKMSEVAGWQLRSFASADVNESLARPLNGHFVLIHEFKTDINAYLKGNPEIGFENLAAMITDGRTHENIQGSLSASQGMQEESQSLYQIELEQRKVVRAALLALMKSQDVDVLAYPTIRQVAAIHDKEQMGTNCRLSANSGLPAISVPIGFTGDGMPVGLELLGPAWSEQMLLNYAFTVEQTLQQRRLPDTTP
ncbi:MAG: amidase [Gammaproteobacteria bacterium]|nr:amidase [Gammaproteobacteria bacterium]